MAASLALFMSLVALAEAPDAGPTPRTLRYSVVSHHAVVGAEVDTYRADGSIDSTYKFNDRGRGPDVRAHYEFGRDGLPTRIAVSGVNYLKAPVDEHLTTDGGRLVWRSTSEHGESTTRGFYLTNDGVDGPERFALLRALARSREALQLLPAGEAQLEALGDATVESHGQRMHVREFAVSGLDFTPATFWVDDEGLLFAEPDKWFGLEREGWEDTNDTLYALRLKAEEARNARLAKTLARRPAQPLAFEHVRLYDSEHALVLEDQTVVVRGALIVAVGAAGSTPVPADAERIDGRGKTLLPGLFDMHVHTQVADGLLHIASGVTSVRDMGNDIETLKRLEGQWDSGTAIGPRLWKAGIIDGHGPYQAPAGLYSDTVAEAVAAVDRYADLGDVQIKVYSSLSPAFVPAIAAEAHRRGLRLSGHVPNGMTATDFVLQGADEVQHINFIFLNFLADKVKDTRTPERFTAVGEYAAGLDLASPAVQRFIDLLLAHHTTVDVTLVAFERMLTGRPGQASPDLAPVLERLPAQVQRTAFAGGLPVTSANDQRYLDAYRALLAMTKRMFEAGVPILVGTDALPGFMLHRELELEVSAGIPAPKALQNATWVPAQLLHQEGALGSVRVGKRADLYLVEGNPLHSMSDVRRGRLVLKDGVVYQPAQLYAAVGVKPSQ